VHGTCTPQEGVCQCNDGWGGIYCDTRTCVYLIYHWLSQDLTFQKSNNTEIVPITNFSRPLMGAVAANQWNYYSVPGHPNRFLSTALLEQVTIHLSLSVSLCLSLSLSLFVSRSLSFPL